jgi:hypothetical protein
MVKTNGDYETMTEMRSANISIDHHWFDRDSMQFFGSKIEGGPYRGRYLIESKQVAWSGPRRYFIYRVGTHGEPEFGSVNIVDAVAPGKGASHNHYASKEEAREAIRALPALSLDGEDAQ